VDLQPKLLRVLEGRQVRRVGSNNFRHVDVRVIAATNRDLRDLVNSGRFRADLYYRLAVLRVRLPPLRERPEDIPLIVGRLLTSLPASPEHVARILDPASVFRMQQAVWAGNVRELRNYLERCLVFRDALPPVAGDLLAPDGPGSREVDVSHSLREVRDDAIRGVERRYLQVILTRHAGNITAAAKAAGVDRAYFYRLLWRHGIR
jgi:two-component system, NtrC family, response regulator GlrR